LHGFPIVERSIDRKKISSFAVIGMLLDRGARSCEAATPCWSNLVFTGGQERTEAEYGTLLSKAGFQLTRVVPTNSAVSIVEAVLA